MKTSTFFNLSKFETDIEKSKLSITRNLLVRFISSLCSKPFIILTGLSGSGNLFIIGTINVDETTYMFSPKVLDRAHVLEFRVNEEEMKEFLNAPIKPDLESIKGLGKNMASDFILKAQIEISEFEDLTEVQTKLIQFFKELKKIGAEFRLYCF